MLFRALSKMPLGTEVTGIRCNKMKVTWMCKNTPVTLPHISRNDKLHWEFLQTIQSVSYGHNLTMKH